MAKLYFKYGAMGSSKSAQALITQFNYEELGMRVWLLKPSVDTRDGKNIVRSRIGLAREAYVIEPDCDIAAVYRKGPAYDVIIADEAQFFTPAQIDQLRLLVDEENLPVLCFGLRTDFLTHFFPGAMRLMELADSITEIKTVCACGSKATVNARIDEKGNIVTEGAQVQLGGNDSYTAMCHPCWMRKIREQKNREQPSFAYGVPAPAAGESAGIFESSGGTVIARWEQTADADFTAYLDELRRMGFTVYDENRIEENRFATLLKGDTAVTVSRFARTGTLRVIAEPKGGLCPLTDPCEARFDTLLTGMKGETSVAAEGMGYIIRLADGSFCIIDGGMGDPDHVDADKLMGILNAQKPADAEKPVIAAWIFTHLHGDHIGVFNCFSLDHHSDVVLERLYFNFPKEEETAASDSPYMLDDSIYRYTQFKKNLAAFYADVPVVKLHSGNRFAVRNAEFEVLYAYDDLYPLTILDGGMNESSLLLRMSAAGQSVLWTGDFAFNAADLVLREYETALCADMLQMAHHGWNGTPALYAAVDPTWALLPLSFDVDPDEMFSAAQNAWLKNSPKVRQVILTSCGTWTLRLPYGSAPGTFGRIPSPGTVYPAYPDLLGE